MHLAYGRAGLEVSVPEGAEVIEPRYLPGLPDEAAAIVNALQRHASVVVQKSLAEGFGLTVVEAMWKSRPVIGSAVGGIVDQIVTGETGFLLDDARDLERYADSVCLLLDNPAERERMGANARQRAAHEQQRDFDRGDHVPELGEARKLTAAIGLEEAPIAPDPSPVERSDSLRRESG